MTLPSLPSCTVVVPAYNAEEYVGAAVASALAQTYPRLEVVVVNDGSTDSTSRVLERFRPAVRYVEQPNLGVAAARNRGIREATGELVVFLDSDDVWLPKRVASMVRFLADHRDIGFVTTNQFLLVGDRPTTRRYYGPPIFHETFRPQRQAYWIIQKNFVAAGVMLPRELVEQHGGFDETLSGPEDWDLWIRLILGGKRVALVPEPLAYYRIRPGSLSRNPARMAENEARVLAKHLPTLTRQGVGGAAGRAAFAEAKAALLRGDLASARARFAEAAVDPGLRTRLRAVAWFAARYPRLTARAAVTGGGRQIS
jgi:glycosyltransferase involved in cell wall biosynthesis